jgi:hypothetical protein
MVLSSPELVKGDIKDCLATLNPEVASNLKVIYSRPSVINNKLKIVMNKGKTFADILTSSCPKLPQLFLEYKEQNAEDAPWIKVKIFKNAPRKESLKLSSKSGQIQLPRGVEVDFCKSYDMRFLLNGDQSSVFQFGPYHNVYSEDQIDELPNEDEKSLNISYVQENSNVTATWNSICARSLKIFLKEGDKDWEQIANMSNIDKNWQLARIKFATKPCTQYKIQVESYWTQHPKVHTDGTLHDASTAPFTTSPAGTPTMQLDEDVLKIVDNEQNGICTPARYEVKCWKAGTNAASAIMSEHNSTNISLNDIAGLTSRPEATCQGRIEYGEEGSQSRTYSRWTDELSVSESPTVGPVFGLIILLNLVSLF